MNLAISFLPQQQEFSQYSPHSECSKNSIEQFYTNVFLSALCRETVISFGYWILGISLGRIFPHCHCRSFSLVVCHLLHRRVLPGISSESDKKPLLGLRGFVFISNNLTMKTILKSSDNHCAVLWEDGKFSLLNSLYFGFIIQSGIWKLQDLVRVLYSLRLSGFLVSSMFSVGKENCIGFFFLQRDHFLKKTISSLF